MAAKALPPRKTEDWNKKSPPETAGFLMDDPVDLRRMQALIGETSGN
jgi:hypothetical protein